MSLGAFLNKRVAGALSGMLLIFISSQFLFAQFVQEELLEFLISGTGNNVGIVSADDDLVLFYELESNTLKRKWEIAVLNEKLNMYRKTSFEIDMNFMVSHVKYFNGNTYLLLKDTNIPMKSIIMVRVNKADGNYEVFPVTDLLPDDVVEFEIIGNSLFLIGQTASGPTVMRFTFGDSRPQVMKGVFNKKTEILHTRVIRAGDAEIIEVITRLKTDGGKGVLFIKQFDENGKVVTTIRLESAKGYNLIDAITALDDDGNIIVAGTFSYKRAFLANGIFTSVINRGEEYTLYYYDFPRLHNFFNYLDSDRQEKMIRKYDGRNSPKYRATLIPESLLKINDEWCFLGEILRLKERNSREYGNMWPMEYRQFSHAVVLGIGEHGKLKWDNCFSMEDLATPSPRQQVFMTGFGDKILLFYRNYFHLIYQIIDKGDVVKGRTFFELITKEKNLTFEKVKRTGEIVKWYDDKFVTFGSMDVMVENQKAGKMFIFNKISVDPDFLDN